MSSTVQYTDMKNSGIKWIGSVPSHWHLHTLYQLVRQVKNKNKDLQEQNLLSLSYGKIKRKDINTKDGLLPASFDGYNIIEAGDIVLRLTDLQNDHTSLRVGQATERGIITSAYSTLRPINPAHSRYLYYLIHAFDLKKGFYGMGSGVRQGLNYDEVKELRIVLPSQEEQDAIVAYLDDVCQQIDLMIDEAKATIEDYKAWRLSTIKEITTHGVSKDVEMVATDISWAKSIPSNWHIGKGHYFASTYSGRAIPGDGTTGNIPVYGSGGPFKKTEDSLYEGEAVLFGRKGTLGKPIYVNTSFWAVDTIYYAVCNEKWMLAKYLYYVLTIFDWKPFITHTALPSIVANEVFSTVFICPPISEQHQIVEKLDCICSDADTAVKETERLIEELELYKRALIYETVTGKRKVV